MVAMTTCIFYRLVMEKVKIYVISVSLGKLENCFYINVY